MRPMATVRKHGPSPTLRRGSPFLAALVLIAGACSAPFEIKPLVAIDGEPLEVAADQPYERAKDFLREGRLGLAIQEFRAALAQEPQSVMALNGLAIAYDELGRPDLAERYFHRALGLKPDSAETLNNIGYSALRRGQVGRARTAFEQARSLAPEDGIVLANLDLVDRPGIPGPATGSPGQEPPSAFVSLVARIDPRTQVLFTRPDPQIMTLAAEHGVHPALFAVQQLPAAD
jgi:tetratricopeptide (TPR) repeat protein